MLNTTNTVNPNLPHYPKGYKKYWTIHNKRYDMTLFVDKHPGGRRMILQGQGRNCTELFESYHSLSTINMVALLDQFFVEDTPVGALDWDATYDWDPNSPGGKFWETLKQRVRTQLRKNGTHKANPLHLVVFIGFCVATLAVLPFFFRGHWFSIILLPLLYFISGTAGMHDGGHCTISQHEWVNSLAAIYGSAISSPLWWQLRHNVGHHEHVRTNVKGKDPDLISLSTSIESTGVRKNTVMYMMPTLTTFGLSFLNEVMFSILLPRNEFKVLGTFSTTDKVFHYASRVVLFSLFVAYPFRTFPLFKAIAFVVVPYAIHGTIFYTLSQISHFNDHCFMEHERLTTDLVKPVLDTKGKHWAVHQVRHTMDWGIPTPYTLGVSVGICYQTVHHLFPQVYHMNLGSIQPVVEQTCKEFGVTYNWVPTVDELIELYGKMLERYGQGSVLIAWTRTKGPIVYALKWVGHVLGQIHPKGW